MNLYAMSEGVELAHMTFTLRAKKKRDDDWQTAFAAITAHPSALLASAVDDAWLAALDARKDEGR